MTKCSSKFQVDTLRTCLVKILKRGTCHHWGFLMRGARVKPIQLLSARLVVKTAVRKKSGGSRHYVWYFFQACKQTRFEENTDVIDFIRTIILLLANKQPLRQSCCFLFFLPPHELEIEEDRKGVTESKCGLVIKRVFSTAILTKLLFVGEIIGRGYMQPNKWTELHIILQ